MRRDKSGSVDFEIAFSAVLATFTTYATIESISQEWAIDLLALSLLVLTLIRRVGVMNGLKEDHQMLRATTYVMSGISYVVSFYLLYWISSMIANTNSQFDPIYVLIVLTLPLTLFIIVIQELAIGGFMRESENIFASLSREYEGSLGGALWGRFSQTARESRTDLSNPTKQSRLSMFEKSKSFNEATIEEKKRVLAHMLGTFVGLITPFLLYGTLGVLIAVWLNISIVTSILIIFCFHIVTGPIDVWVSGYGLIPLEQAEWLPRTLVRITGIIFIFQIILFA